MLAWVSMWFESIFIGCMLLLTPSLPFQSRDWVLFVCDGWVHKRCSNVYGRLQNVTDILCATCRGPT